MLIRKSIFVFFGTPQVILYFEHIKLPQLLVFDIEADLEQDGDQRGVGVVLIIQPVGVQSGQENAHESEGGVGEGSVRKIDGEHDQAVDYHLVASK